ncbi:MAG TPA: hypothetical protein VHX38_17515 [Pseudonocardiaceae bacterium]|jgi:hypothetical protein|nr:hypothetical protein [Pseudonocardiaceae bacterium]
MTACGVWSRCGTSIACTLTAVAALALIMIVSTLVLVVLVVNRAMTEPSVDRPAAPLCPYGGRL